MKSHCLFFAAFFLAGVSSTAQSRPPMFSPFFLFSYDPNMIHFDPAPAFISRLCPFLHKHEPNLWLYAKYEDADERFFVVSGYLRGAESGKVEADDSGAVVEIRQGKCSLVDAAWATTGWIDPSAEASLPESAGEILPGYHAPRVCAAGDCHYVLRSRREKAVLVGLLSDALVSFTKAFGGQDKFLSAFNQKIHDRSLLDPIVRECLENYEKR